MASFTGVGDTTELTLSRAGEDVSVALSGTYNMEIALQRKQGTGSWRTIKIWDTADATVAYTYTTISDNETVRLVVNVDTSGTCTATLTDSTDRVLDKVLDSDGNALETMYESGKKRAAGWSWESGGVVNATASLALTAAAHAHRVVTANAAAGMTVTMPAATGSGDKYTVFCGTTVTSNNLVIAANGTDTLAGGVSISTDIAGITMLAGGTDDKITMNGSTTGGLKGSWVELTDVASGLWMVNGFLVSTGTEATPFGAS